MSILTPAKQLKKPKKHPSKEDQLKFINNLILKANLEGKTSIRTYGIDGVFGSSELYNGNTPFVDDILKELHSAGYNANIQFDMKQLVDIYLQISWD